jgi:hypothetical protein
MSFFALSSGIKQLTCASRLGNNAQLQTLPEHVSVRWRSCRRIEGL